MFYICSIKSFSETFSVDGNIVVPFGISTLIAEEQVLSDGLPIDAVSMLLTAKTLRSAKSKIYILLADNLAVLMGIDVEKTKETCILYKDAAQTLLTKLKMENCEIILSSDMAKDDAYLAILQEISSSEEMQVYGRFKTYIHHQTAQMKYF